MDNKELKRFSSPGYNLIKHSSAVPRKMSSSVSVRCELCWIVIQRRFQANLAASANCHGPLSKNTCPKCTKLTWRKNLSLFCTLTDKKEKKTPCRIPVYGAFSDTKTQKNYYTVVNSARNRIHKSRMGPRFNNLWGHFSIMV